MSVVVLHVQQDYKALSKTFFQPAKTDLKTLKQ